MVQKNTINNSFWQTESYTSGSREAVSANMDFTFIDLTLICYRTAVLALLLLNDAERYSRLSSDDSSHD